MVGGEYLMTGRAVRMSGSENLMARGAVGTPGGGVGLKGLGAWVQDLGD